VAGGGNGKQRSSGVDLEMLPYRRPDIAGPQPL